ncbi:hypothetical protein LZ31DRAFT_289991 [Colletotrichum somersetense]|nr:hypothetical protein LZ31DRAFT_289991 [Colletotrichum somersetense]
MGDGCPMRKPTPRGEQTRVLGTILPMTDGGSVGEASKCDGLRSSLVQFLGSEVCSRPLRSRLPGPVPDEFCRNASGWRSVAFSRLTATHGKWHRRAVLDGVVGLTDDWPLPFLMVLLPRCVPNSRDAFVDFHESCVWSKQRDQMFWCAPGCSFSTRSL